MKTTWTLVGGLVALVCMSACECGKPPPTVEKQKKEGEACTSDDVCETGLCDSAPGFPTVCVRKCSVGCVAGEVCTQLTPNRFACQPDLKKLCQACQVDSDCPYPADHCLVVNGENVCGRDCAFDQACPSGYHCVNGKGVDTKTYVQQCTPEVASCACLARGDFLQPCETTNAFGTCKGTKQCDLVANKVVCDARTPAAEVCNGVDDNCNGTTDEGQATVGCGVGECQRTVSTCADGGVASCKPGQPAAELCNGKDDDCDGTVDNGFNLSSDVTRCGSCTNACALPHASPMCQGGACKVAACDTNFGDCNHVDSDGCETNTQTDATNCGGCGIMCVQANSTASCVAGKCAFVCAPGWVDLDGNPANGCEYQCTFKSATDVPDLNLDDANCDGIDGEANNAVFVSVKGDDAASGDKAHPVRSPGQAVQLMVLNNKRDMYLAGTGPTAADVYTGSLQLNLMTNSNVAGGYDPVTWKRSLLTTTVIQGGNPAVKIEGSNNVLVQALRFEGGNGDVANPTAYGAYVKASTSVKLESVNLIAGNGVDGTPGAAGSQGTAGDPGAAGGKGCVGDTVKLACAIWFSVCNSPSPGPGGASTCGYPGGSGGTPTYSTGATGGPGTAAPNGSGLAGSGAPDDSSTGPRGLPYAGSAGSGGTLGSNGAAASAVGTLSATGFTVSSGTGGTAGTPGKGGGGGGGGAGKQYSDAIFPTCQTFGSAGGGGGGGGCGGNGGAGGLGGGASIGLFLTAGSTVSGQGVVIKSGNGGKGGNGGAAGPGGSGGTGGGSPYNSDQGFASVGGPGGNGGSGGVGGVGGGGAGGNVYGLAKSSTSTWTPLSNTSVTMGTPGVGGTSPSPLPAAPSGVAKLTEPF